VLSSHMGPNTDAQQGTSSTISHQKTAQMHGATFPLGEDGSTYHLETKLSEVSNRILTVGDPSRAERIAKYLDCVVFDKTSHRGFRTITGLYKNIPVSIVAIGMGIAAMDFFIRECRAVIDGDMAIIRIGTCGVVKSDIPVGTVVVQDASVCVLRNPDGFRSAIHNVDVVDDDVSVSTTGEHDSISSTSDDDDQKLENDEETSDDDIEHPTTLQQPAQQQPADSRPSRIVKEIRREAYYVTLPVKASDQLTDLLHKNVAVHVEPKWIVRGLNATADSFYSSQGRTTLDFKDKNESLIDELIQKIPSLTSLEMETFHLFDMADVCKRGKIHAASCVIALAQRQSEEFLDNKVKKLREKQCGLSVLDTLVGMPLEKEMQNGVWTSTPEQQGSIQLNTQDNK